MTVYDPSTMVASFPPYRWAGRLTKAGEGLPFRNRAYQALRNVIGFDIWHEDPERHVPGQRRDDSCRWFDRTPGEYASALKETLEDRDIMQQIANLEALKIFWRSAYLDSYPESERGWKRNTPGEVLAVVTMVGQRLEHIRWWHANRGRPWWKLKSRKRFVLDLLADLALNPGDNLATFEEAESLVRSTASALNRRFRPWWRHPRWHVHHWRINFMLPRNLHRMFQRCDGCGGRIGWGKSPCISGDKTLCMTRCVGVANAPSPNAKAPK